MLDAAAENDPFRPIIRRELARRRLLDFAKRVYPQFQDPPHIRFIAELLESIERGDAGRRRVLICVPVRHGKSVIASQVFPAWFLGRHPKHDVILASHSEDLATRNSRIAKELFEDKAWPFEARLSRDSTAAGRWNTTAGGGCYAIGVGGGITGRGANVLIVDDALHDGLSESERETAWRWYSEVAVPRLEPGGAVIVVGARFAGNDLCGRILESEDGPNWLVVRLPAIAEADDPLGRALGDPLWPERISLAELEMRRVQMGSRAFESQFQQNPLPVGGGLIKAEWLQHRYTTIPDDLKITAALDVASKTSLANDFTALIVLGSTKAHHLVLDVQRRRVDFPDLKRMVLAAYETHRPSVIYVEDASGGIPLVQELKRETALPIVPVTAKGSKIARVEAVTGILESGKLLLPDESKVPAPWLLEFERELLGFPGAKHDDQVDALALGLAKLASRSRELYWDKITVSHPNIPIFR